MTEVSELPLGVAILALIRTHLEGHKTRIDSEIRSYPMPIPACDAQYNYLLEERGRVNRELKTLHTLTADLSRATAPCAAVRTFIDASSCLDDALQRELLSRLHPSSGPGGPGVQG